MLALTVPVNSKKCASPVSSRAPDPASGGGVRSTAGIGEPRFGRTRRNANRTSNMTTNTTRQIQAALAGALLLAVIPGLASAADIRVPSDHPTIQAAVDAAADGDTIHIASGVYTNQVRILSRRLTLIGQPGTILRVREGMTPFPETTFSGLSPAVSVLSVRASDVTLRGLTFEGERLAGSFVDPDLGILSAVFLRDSHASVEDCAFHGFRESAPGREYASCITGVSFGSTVVNVRVAGCTFVDSYRGMLLAGLPDRLTMNATVENNTIIGLGPHAVDGVGIWFREGVGGRIANNTISGFSYVGPAAQVEFPISFGILAADASVRPEFREVQPLEIEDNTLRDNQIHIGLTKASGSSIRNNRLQGTAPGVLPIGLVVSGTNLTIANNLFEDMPEGIRLLGNDPDFGTILGAALNASVTGNRFSDVALPINRQPLATATEQGTVTMTGPFPPPALGIRPAVLLAWPGIEEGYVVEAAPTPDGPWSLAGATPFVQDGQHSVSVPAGDGNRFFRLRKP